MARPSYDDGDAQMPIRSAFPAPPTAVKRLMLINALVFVVCVLMYVASSETYGWVARVLGLATDMWRENAPWVPVWQLFTYGFLHSVVDPWHIVMNMLVLYFFGSMLEHELGARRLLITYFGAQILGGILFLALGLAVGKDVLLIGASGGCFGVMVAAATLWPRSPVILIFIPMRLWTMALIFVGIEVYQFLLATALGAAADGRVSHITHLGGIIYGFVAAKTGLVFWDPWRALSERRITKAVERAEGDEKRMDQLLEKIHREGMASLSRSEREFLKRVSSRR